MKPISLFFMKSTLTTILFMLIALTSISQYEEHVNYHITVVDGMSKAEEGTFQLTKKNFFTCFPKRKMVMALPFL